MDETTQRISSNGSDMKCSSDDSKNAGNMTQPPISGPNESSADTELQQNKNDDQLKSEPLALNSKSKDVNFAATIEDPIKTATIENPIKTENRSGSSKDDEIFVATKTTQKCEPCLYDNINEEAQSFCVVCAEYLCKTCTRDHRKSKTTRGHKVLDGEELPATADVFKKLKETMACVDHLQAEVSYKCEDHDTYICTDCIAVNHRKCEKVTEISKVIAVSDERREAVLQTLKAINDSTTAIRASKETNIESLRQNAVDVTIDRQQHIKSIHTHLEELNRQSANETEIYLAKELEKLNKEVNKCKDIETEEKQHEELLHVASNHGSIQEQNVLYEKISRQADILRKESEHLDVKAQTTLQFQKNTKIQEISSIGRVFVKKENEDGKVFYRGSLESSSDALDENAKEEINFAAKETETLSSKLKDDKDAEISIQVPLIQGKLNKMRTMYDIKADVNESTCCVSAIVLLANGRFVISDRANKKIKVLKADFSVSISYKLDSEPIDMCEVSPDYLAVISNNVKEVRKFRLGDNGVIPDGFFPTKYYPISISNSNTGVIILFSDEPKNNSKKSDEDVIELQIRNINKGIIILQTSSFKNIKSREIVLENANRVISLGSDPEMFLVAEEKKIHCFEIDGAGMTEVWFYRSYRDNILEGVSDVAMDSERNVYVCGEGSRNIHQLSLDNYRNNRVLMSVPATPTSLCVDSSRRIIVVGCKNDDFLYVTYFQ